MNNLKKIREIYGITQDEIAKAINVSRATISIWEKENAKKASDSVIEKLSLFYGIGPEFFYNEEISDVVRDMLLSNSKRQRELEGKEDIAVNKAEAFNRIFSTLTFDEALENYMIAMKMMMATADSGSLKKLEIANKIHKKMGKRLEQILVMRREDDEAGESLSELIDSLNDNID